MEWITNIWNALPKALQRVVGIGIGAGLACCMVLFLWLVWGSGYIQDKMGIVITKSDLTKQTDAIQEHNDASRDADISAAIISYDTMMKEYLSEERKLAVDTALVPLLQELKAIKRLQNRMNNEQNNTSERLDQTSNELSERLERVLKASNPERAEEQLNAIIQQNQELQRKLIQIDETILEIKAGRKGTKKTF